LFPFLDIGIAYAPWRFDDHIKIDGKKARWKKRPMPPEPKKAKAAEEKKVNDPRQAPVSSAAKIAGKNKTENAWIESVLDLIDAIHGDGALQPIPINTDDIDGGVAGYASTHDGKAISISVPMTGLPTAHFKFALTHEIGHWLDHAGIPGEGRYASQLSSGPLDEWRTAVEKSQAFAELNHLPKATMQERVLREYSLRWREIFARSYVQFIAEESGNAEMLESVRQVRSGEIRNVPAARDWPPSWHWTSEDFAPIRNAMRRAFQSFGWMK